MDSDGLGSDLVSIGQKLPGLKARIDEISALWEEWNKRRQHSVDMGIGSVDGDSQDELERRLHITNMDISLCIKCISDAIAKEKNHQKQLDVYNIATPEAAQEMNRKLNRATEELELRNAVTAAVAQRQLQQANRGASQKDPVPSRQTERVEVDSPLGVLLIRCSKMEPSRYPIWKPFRAATKRSLPNR